MAYYVSLLARADVIFLYRVSLSVSLYHTSREARFTHPLAAPDRRSSLQLLAQCTHAENRQKSDPACAMTHELIVQYSVKDVDSVNSMRL